MPTAMLAAVLAVLSSSSSLASTSFPGGVQSHLGGDTPFPACTVCHESNAGGFGTVTRAHGIALMDAGLVAGDTASLNSALDALEADDTDSDEGGVGDIDELRAGTNPNDGSDDGSDGTGSTGSVQYGFGCAAGGVVSAPFVAVLVVLAVTRRRRR